MHEFYPWLFPFLLFAVTLALGTLIRQGAARNAFRVLGVAPDPASPEFLRLTRLLLPLAAVLGLLFARPFFPLSPEAAELVHKTILCAVIVTTGLALSEILLLLVREKIGRVPMPLPTTTLTMNLIRLVVLTLAGLMVLSVMGIAITPLLTALGVGSLAVALGLHETLSNFFAGIYILKSQIIKIDDYVQVDGGHEGFVVDVGLRAVHLRTLSNKMIYVPTSKASQGIITNYSHPSPDFWIPVDLRVAYGTDLEKVERVTLETARKVMREWGVSTEEPVIRFQAFGSSGVELAALLHTREIGQKALLVHQFLKALDERYRQEGIEIPLPRQVVYLNSD